jgi:hypothetical protein
MHRYAYLGATLLCLQACESSRWTPQAPVLEFPETGLDDLAAYEGYKTRFFRDANGNTLQVYLNTRDGRVVHVWANAANESAAFTVRDTTGSPASIAWGGPEADTRSDGTNRSVRHLLAAEVGALEIGWFLLGTMRQERDFQYMRWHERPYTDPPFILTELTELISSMERLPADERTRHLALLDANDIAELQSRLEPRVELTADETSWSVFVEHTSLDGRNHLTLELRGDPSVATATLSEGRVSIRPSSNERVEFSATVITDADALTPLGRERLFNDAFEDYHERQRRTADSIGQISVGEPASDPWLTGFRRFERQVLGLELLSSEEKLLASLPNYATYFGRDQMMSALMLEPISSVDLQELVIASVLRKLSPTGNASHEEALGGQAIRENAAEYSALIHAWEEAEGNDPDRAAAQLARARERLANLPAVRENYRMVDDDFQLPILVARYLSRSDVPPERKRRFLTSAAGRTQSHLDALVRNLAFVTDLARPYAEQPSVANLVSFFHRDDEGWLPGSWRDSRAGYGGGRFAMDVNAVWVPNALEAIANILRAVEQLGLSVEDAVARVPGGGMTIADYARDPALLDAAIATWHGARKRFEVHLSSDEIRRRVNASLQPLSRAEREFWQRRLTERDVTQRPLSFLALSLDSGGQPVAAVNTDPATALFLGDYTEEILQEASDPTTILEMLDAIMRPYPVGLFIEGLGPVVVNDAYASPEVQQRFREDLYHSPRVVWGREVNLLLLGLAHQIRSAYDASGQLRDESEAFQVYVAELRRALERTEDAVEASGLSNNELWSYRIDGSSLRPVRYGTSSDIQLWNVTDLAVRFLMDGLPPR